MDTPSTPLDAKHLAYSPADAARLLGVSRAQFWKLHAAGRLPAPVYLGAKAPRWVADELRAWLAAGAPDRQSWLKLKGGL